MEFIFKEDGSVNSSRTKETYIKKYHNNIYLKILDYNVENDISWNEKLHRYYFKIENNDCLVCGKKTKYRGFIRGYNKTCSNKCSSNIPNRQEERMKTLYKNNLDKYGVENVFQLDSVKKKIKNHNIEKYGVEYHTQSKTIKDKIKKTNIEKYGHTCSLLNEDIKKKTLKTNLEKYGYTSHMMNEKIKNKFRVFFIEKYGGLGFSSNLLKEKAEKTNLERHGVKNYFSNKDFILNNKSIMIKKYDKFINNDDYELVRYNKSIFEILHKKCDSLFKINSQQLYTRTRFNGNDSLCTVCNPIGDTKSLLENEVKTFISSINIDYIDTDKTILKPKHLDIYIPNHNLAIEFNGLYWHSELYKDKNYHLNKTIGCEEKGVQLIHIFEDDWKYKQDIVKSIIRNKLNKIDNKIYARKCEIKEVKSNIARQFLDNNHIQGFSRSKYKLGLYYNNELVSLMTFGYRRTNTKKEFELIRFCNILNTNVIGASSKLFKHFINNYMIEEDYILSYADASMFDGNMYKTLGFDYIHRTLPNYFWVVDDVRHHRFKYNKQNLIKEGYDPDLTEVQIMHMREYFRIYGVGQDRYEYKL